MAFGALGGSAHAAATLAAGQAFAPAAGKRAISINAARRENHPRIARPAWPDGPRRPRERSALAAPLILLGALFLILLTRSRFLDFLFLLARLARSSLLLFLVSTLVRHDGLPELSGSNLHGPP